MFVPLWGNFCTPHAMERKSHSVGYALFSASGSEAITKLRIHVWKRWDDNGGSEDVEQTDFSVSGHKVETMQKAPFR